MCLEALCLMLSCHCGLNAHYSYIHSWELTNALLCKWLVLVRLAHEAGEPLTIKYELFTPLFSCWLVNWVSGTWRERIAKGERGKNQCDFGMWGCNCSVCINPMPQYVMWITTGQNLDLSGWSGRDLKEKDASSTLSLDHRIRFIIGLICFIGSLPPK